MAFRVLLLPAALITKNRRSQQNKAYDSNILEYYREKHMDTLNYLVACLSIIMTAIIWRWVLIPIKEKGRTYPGYITGKNKTQKKNNERRTSGSL